MALTAVDPSFRMDLHVHSRHSRDARGSVLDIAWQARRAGLHGFAVTDHDTLQGHKEIGEAAQRTGLLIVPGVEVTTAEGHLIALGVRAPVPCGLGLAETLELLQAQDAVGVAAHPLRLFTGIGPSGLRDRAHEGVLHAAEARNARERPLVQENTERLCRELGLAMTGGSDAHLVKETGRVWTRFDEPLATVEDVLDAVRAGRTVAEGGRTPRRWILQHRLGMLRDRLGGGRKDA